jgi:glycerol uptake facilitator-like aquaporin
VKKRRYSITSLARASTVGGIALQRRLLPACPSCLWNCLMPALFAGSAYMAQLWLFWLAPILGAAIAGVVTRWQHDLPDAD